MEYVTFFFTNFWHWLGLLCILAVLCPWLNISFGQSNKSKSA